ncbi:MAG: hypothetical protein WC796_04395 [Candidatus Pacearchaeota archaeon]|jgi:hypothetical protein
MNEYPNVYVMSAPVLDSHPLDWWRVVEALGQICSGCEVDFEPHQYRVKTGARIPEEVIRGFNRSGLSVSTLRLEGIAV